MKASLADCPRCGEPAARKTVPLPYMHGWVGCPRCRIYVNWVREPSAAAAKWNRMATEAVT